AFVNKMDRVGADFERVSRMITDRLRSRPLPVMLPLGSADSFRGGIDVVSMRALVWDGAASGASYRVDPIPAEDLPAAQAAHERVVEAACEVDDALLEKFLSGGSIGADELHAAIRKGTCALAFVPVLCGSSFHNQGVQTLLDAVVRYLPSPLDVAAIEGVDPDSGKAL